MGNLNTWGKGSKFLSSEKSLTVNIIFFISALTASFRLVQLDQCRGNADASCMRDLRADKLHEAILVCFIYKPIMQPTSLFQSVCLSIHPLEFNILSF